MADTNDLEAAAFFTGGHHKDVVNTFFECKEGISIGFLVILTLGVLTMWYILYTKITMGRRKRELASLSYWEQMIDFGQALLYGGEFSVKSFYMLSSKSILRFDHGRLLIFGSETGFTNRLHGHLFLIQLEANPERVRVKKVRSGLPCLTYFSYLPSAHTTYFSYLDAPSPSPHTLRYSSPPLSRPHLRQIHQFQTWFYSNSTMYIPTL